MLHNSTALPLAAAQAATEWLARRNNAASLLMEAQVTNLETIKGANAVTAFTALMLCTAPMTAVACACWLAAAVALCRKGGDR